jgi:hypothetical protein
MRAKLGRQTAAWYSVGVLAALLRRVPLELALDVLNREPDRVVGRRRHLVTDQLRTERP